MTLHYSLFETEHNQFKELPSNYYTYVVGSCIVWTLIYTISGKLIPNHEKLRKELSSTEWKDLKSRVVSSIHAVYAVVISAYYLLNDKGFKNWNIIHSSDDISLAISVTLGYFIYDYLLIVTHSDPKELGGTGMFIHHICAAACLLGSSYYRVYQIFVLLFCLTEATTPFVNARVLLVRLGKQDSLLYVVNGIAMWLGFIIFRFSLVFLVPYALSLNRDIVAKMSIFTHTLSILSYFSMSSLNTLWTWKITKGVLKVVGAGASSA